MKRKRFKNSLWRNLEINVLQWNTSNSLKLSSEFNLEIESYTQVLLCNWELPHKYINCNAKKVKSFSKLELRHNRISTKNYWELRVKFYFLLPKGVLLFFFLCCGLYLNIYQIKPSVIFSALKIKWRFLWKEARSKLATHHWTFGKKKTTTTLFFPYF